MEKFFLCDIYNEKHKKEKTDQKDKEKKYQKCSYGF